MDNQINISLPEGFNQPNFEVIQTEGLAQSPISDVKINGNLNAPFDYCENIRTPDNGHGSYFLISREFLTIKLFFEPQKYHTVEVLGSLKSNKKFTALEINGLKSYSRDELVKTLEKYAGFFLKDDALEYVIEYLNNFKGSLTVSKVDEKAKNGGYNQSAKKDVNVADLPSFTLKMPLFQGEDDHIFTVKILIEMTESSTKFFLISPEILKDYDRICVEKLEEVINKNKDKDAFRGISFIWE